jgi:hypothetical protein
MSIEKQAGRELGLTVHSVLSGIKPEHYHEADGMTDVYYESFKKKAHKPVMQFVAKLFDQFGEGQTKVARHLKALSLFPREHSAHTKRASDEVFEVIRSEYGVDKFLKNANLAAGVAGASSDALLWAAGLSSALVGAGGGAGLWHMNRESSEEDAELEAKRKKIQQYKSLTEELKATAKRKQGLV